MMMPPRKINKKNVSSKRSNHIEFASGFDSHSVIYSHSTSRSSNIRILRNDRAMLLPYCNLLFFLLIISINQSLLHLHLLDEKNALFIQKSPKPFIHLVALFAILAYVIFTYRRISQKNIPREYKIALTVIAAFLIISNILLLVKSLNLLSLPYLSLMTVGCFLIALMIFRFQQYLKKYELQWRPDELSIDNDVLQTQRSAAILNNCNESISSMYYKRIKDNKKKYPSNWSEITQSSHIESIQIFIGFLGLLAVSFEIIYDKIEIRNPIKAFQLEAPQLIHHFCMMLQILFALMIAVYLITKKTSFGKIFKRTHDNQELSEIVAFDHLNDEKRSTTLLKNDGILTTLQRDNKTISIMLSNTGTLSVALNQTVLVSHQSMRRYNS